MSKVEKLKELAVKLGCASTASSVPGNTITEVLDFINAKYPIPKAPTTAGDYNLSVTVSEGVASYSWKKTI